MKNSSFQSRVFVYKKKNLFVGVALDFDLIVQGKNMVEALERLNDGVRTYLRMCTDENESDQEIYRKAPNKYFKLYDFLLDLQKKKCEERKQMEGFSGYLNFRNNLVIA